MRGLVVGLGRPDEEPVELAPHGVDVDRDPGILEGNEPDPEGALDERRPVVGGTLGDEPGETRVDEHEPIDHDRLALETNLGSQGGALERRRRGGDLSGGRLRCRERDDVRAVHAPKRRSVA